jgi:C4-dicarboxylate-specific signal transduction histidine kinase
MNNAFDAMRSVRPVGTRHVLSLQTVSDEKNNQTQIKIRDNGPGIPKDVIDKIFNPFLPPSQQERGRVWDSH